MPNVLKWAEGDSSLASPAELAEHKGARYFGGHEYSC